MPEFVTRTETERAAKRVLDVFLMPDRLESPVRRLAAGKLAEHHSKLAANDKALLYDQTRRDPELGAMFAQSVIEQKSDLLGFPEVRKLVFKEIPKMKDSLGQAALLAQATKEKLNPEEASFVIKNVLDYLEHEVISLPERARFSESADLDLRFSALQRMSEFHTEADKYRLSQLARADDQLADCVQLMNARTSSEGRQHAQESHTQTREDLHSGNDSDRENRPPVRRYDERSHDRREVR